MAIGAVIGGVGSILGGIMGGQASSAAGQKLQAAGQAAAQGVTSATTQGQQGIATGVTNSNNLLNSLYGTRMGGLSPYLMAGSTGVNNLMSAVAPGGALSKNFSFDPSQIYNDPSYQFNLQQGTQAIQRSAASQGGLLGSGSQKALAQYASGLASNEYSNAFNRSLTSFQTNRQNQMQNLTALLGLGQFGNQQANQLTTSFGLPMGQNTMQGALSSAQLGLQGAQAAGQFNLQGAGAGAAGMIGASNAYSSILPGVAGSLYGYGAYNGGFGGGYGGGGYGGGYGSPGGGQGTTSYDGSGNQIGVYSGGQWNTLAPYPLAPAPGGTP